MIYPMELVLAQCALLEAFKRHGATGPTYGEDFDGRPSNSLAIYREARIRYNQLLRLHDEATEKFHTGEEDLIPLGGLPRGEMFDRTQSGGTSASEIARAVWNEKERRYGR